VSDGQPVRPAAAAADVELKIEVEAEVAVEVAPDGSPVEVFDRLPAGRAVDYLRAVTPSGGSVLDLGCGAGRIGGALLASGHAVVGVDVCTAMLDRAAARGIEVVLGDAATLDLDRRFDTVVLASYLVNDATTAPALLAACRRHVADDGVVVVQRYDPVWARAGKAGEARSGAVSITVSSVTVDGARLSISVAYSVDGRTWHQSVSAVVVDDDDLDRLAADAGLVVDAWLDEFRTWAVLRPRGVDLA
jgi:SAM-dependent methyltransferase